jgi:4-diphosphocytidyl-2-C-methyl-D-erythritol kinase
LLGTQVAAGDNRAMRTITVPAPAKLNLFLHVTGRRADRRHTLETLFVAVDFCDTLTLTQRDDGEIRRTTDLPGIAPDDDLAVRAANALRRASGCGAGVDIAITKRIPQGGGLGGGSSDAGSVLLALNRLWNVDLSRTQLMDIAATLGADVPFFVFGEPALAHGVGDACRAVSLPGFWATVIVPPVAVSTTEIFAAPELTRDTPSVKMECFSEGYGRNDLQAAVVARFPQVAAALAALRKRSALARLTGSGGCVFAPFASEHEARRAFEARPAGMAGFVARTLARHPLAAFA